MNQPLFSDELRERPLDVTGIENAILDLLVRLPHDDVLADLGLVKGTMKLVDTEEQAAILDRVGALSPDVQPGGSCANVLRTVARLGARTSYSSAVGFDEQGTAFKTGLVDHAVKDRCAQLNGTATGTSVILVSEDGERTMNTHLGACRDYAASHVPHTDVENSRLFFTTAYIWDTPNQIEAIEDAIATARRSGTRLAMDLADPFAVDRSRDHIKRHIDLGFDVVFANAEEARIMTGLEAEPAARRLSEMIRIAVVTDGAEGAYIAAGSDTLHIPAHKVDLVDTTGAGDCFAAGFLHGLIREKPLEVCGEIATTLAADTITHLGVRLSDDVERRVEAIG